MEFLITEKQLKVILSEGTIDTLSESLKMMYNFTSQLVKKVLRTFGVNLRMFLTWGTSVGGFVMPLDNFIRNGNFEMNSDERMLVLAGVCFVLFFEGKRGLGKILEKINEQNLNNVFEETLNKGIELKEYFMAFIDSLKSSSSLMLEIIAYSFLIPISVDIFEIAHENSTIEESTSLIVDRILSSGVVLLSREILINIINRMMMKFKR